MLFDRVEQTTSTTGTGTLSLVAPTDASRRSFVQAAGSGAQVLYCIETADGLAYEYGVGTATAGTPDTLTRTTVLLSSNSNALVNFPAGTKRVYSCLPASASGFGATRLPSTWGASIGVSGWRREPTGLIIQWGTSVGNAAAYNELAITFPITFPSACHTVVVCNGDANTQQGVWCGVTIWNTAAFNYKASNGGSFRINWLAVGA